MAINLINNGQEDWLSTLNSDLSQIGAKVARQNLAVTFVNGFSGDIEVVHYTFDTHILTIVQGWISTGNATLSAGVKNEIFKVPAGTDLGSCYVWTTNGSMRGGRVTVADDGTVSFEMEDEVGTGGLLSILGARNY